MLLFENVLPQQIMIAIVVIVFVIIVAIVMDEIVESLVREGDMDDRRNVPEL